MYMLSDDSLSLSEICIGAGGAFSSLVAFGR